MFFSPIGPLQEIRRRHRYLAHLPLTCEFSMCELALQPPILSKVTLDTFAGGNAGFGMWIFQALTFDCY